MFCKEHIEHFWDWFRIVHDDYRQPQYHSSEKIDYLGDELNVHLWNILPAFCFEIQWNAGDNGDATLIISCDGEAEYFKIAHALVAAAPVIPGWRIRALRPPTDIDRGFAATFPRMRFRPASLFVMPSPDDENPQRLECLFIYMPGYKKELEDEYLEAAELVLQNLLGEETAATTLGVLVPMPPDHGLEREDGIISIMELPAWLDRMPSGYAVDARGKIGKSTV
ncbi:MAG TPA: hypothetical protein VGM63_00225 [Mucilaginibacter sp.]|jgi:hypothetical protein